jgi:hypothetical protein
MAAKLITLPHKIAIQLHLVAESCTIAVFAPGGHSGNFWIRPRMFKPFTYSKNNVLWMEKYTLAKPETYIKAFSNPTAAILILSYNHGVHR